MFDKNHSSAIKLFRPAATFILVFYLASLAGVANGLDKTDAAKNENEAIEAGKIWELDSIKKAGGLFEQTAADWEKLAEPRRAVFCLNEAARLAQMYSDYDAAFRALNKALKIAAAHNLLEEESVSASLYAIFSYEKSDPQNSRKFSERALSLSSRVGSARAKAYASYSKGIYEYFYGNMRTATDLFEQAQTYAQETQDIFIMSQTLFYVGFAYIREGYSYKASDKMNLALQQCEKFNYKKGQALSYFGIAASYFHTEKQKALDYFQKSESLLPVNFEWMERARIFGVIGNIYMDLGEFELAESNFQKAIANYERANYLSGKITTLTLLADTYLLEGDLAKAKRTYELTLELAAPTGNKFRLANIKEGLGNVAFRENNFDGAVRNYLAALQIYNDIGVRLPVIENLLGNAYKQKGDYQKAREYYSSALKTNRQTKNFLELSETLFNFAKLNLLENNSGKALDNINESVEVTENLYADVANSNLKSTYLSSVFDRYELFTHLSMKMHRQHPGENYDLQALQTAEKSRARVMLENLSLTKADLTKDADAEIVRREKEIRVLLNTKADELTDLLSKNAEKSVTAKIGNEIGELKNELEDIKAKLKEQSPVYSAIKNPAPFDVVDFQKNILDEDSLLLEFSFGAEESYLWLVGKNEVSAYVLPPREGIESNIETLRALLNEHELKNDESVDDYQQRIAAAEIKYNQEAKQLSRKLFGQIAGKLEKKRLIIVPDGELRYFPVAALPLPDSDADAPFLLTHEIIYEPSAQTLAVLAKSQRPLTPAAKNLLVFSDPVFTSDDPRFSPAGKPAETETGKTETFRFVESLNNLKRLSASKDESETIIETLGDSSTDNYSGFRATRENLLNLKTDDYKILHFATHGYVNDERPELSGIVLSRFDEKGRRLTEFFRIQDIYALNLNADLVVLSACETGVGKEIKGEGLMSLNNAFLQTGARSVMASLWKVEDEATLELMKNFYGALADEQLTPSQSLRRAQIKLYENPRFSSPFYWAAFTVQGDLRSVPNLSGSYGSWIYLLPMLPIPLIGFYVYRRRIRTRSIKM